MSADVQELFDTEKYGPTLVVTVGNSLHLDDGVGPYIAQHSKKEKTGITVFNAENKPESILSSVEHQKPKRTIIIDAADFGGSAGEARIIPEEIIPDTTLSTHTFPLAVISKMLQEDTGTEVVFLGIQAKKLGLGEGLSEEIETSANELIELITGETNARNAHHQRPIERHTETW